MPEPGRSSCQLAEAGGSTVGLGVWAGVWSLVGVIFELSGGSLVPCFNFFLNYFIFETGSHNVAWAALELPEICLTLLLQ